MTFEYLEFRLHAVERMFEREISVADVEEIIRSGKVIEDYPHDAPYPSCLMLGVVRGRSLHVVVAKDEEFKRAIVVTVYQPDAEQWEPGFERRKHS